MRHRQWSNNQDLSWEVELLGFRCRPLSYRSHALATSQKLGCPSQASCPHSSMQTTNLTEVTELDKHLFNSHTTKFYNWQDTIIQPPHIILMLVEMGAAWPGAQPLHSHCQRQRSSSFRTIPLHLPHSSALWSDAGRNSSVKGGQSWRWNSGSWGAAW